jgi:hypothetical protein
LSDVQSGDTASVESAHGQLGAWLADCLGRDNAGRSSGLNHFIKAKVIAIAELANTANQFAFQNRTAFDHFDS